MAKVVYTGVSSKARKCKALYVGVSNKARKIKKGYVGVSNKARLFYTSDIIYIWDVYDYTSTTTYSFSTPTTISGAIDSYNNRGLTYYSVEIGSSTTINVGRRTFDAYSPNPIGSGAVRDMYYLYDNYYYSGRYNTNLIVGLTSEPTSLTNGMPVVSFDGRGNGNGFNSTISTLNVSTTYRKGSTNFGTVTAVNNPNAYPANGRSGARWYVLRT